MAAINAYHYTESGLDNIWLSGGGVEEVTTPSGKEIRIKDIEGLHKEIGRILIEQKKNLTGKEVRFLRQEMLLSQANLAKLLEVTEQTIHRWEAGKSDIPKMADHIIRWLYKERFSSPKGIKIWDALERLAEMEDAIDGGRLTVKKSGGKWQLAA